MAGRGERPPSGFGERLKLVREEKGLSQKQLGEMADVHPNTIAKLERGEQEPAWPLVLALAKALGVSCEAFGSVPTNELTSADRPVAEEKPASETPAKKPAAKKGKGKK